MPRLRHPPQGAQLRLPAAAPGARARRKRRGVDQYRAGNAAGSRSMSEFAIPRYNYAAQFPGLDEEVIPRVAALLVRGDYIRGPEVGEFETRFAEFLHVRSVIGVNSGTDALILALEALGVGPGDEVITVANTWHSTALAAVRVG